MMKLSIITPYYQCEPGILQRALASVLRQRLLPDMAVNVIVVDDGSPAPAGPEIQELEFAPPFQLTLITQSNGGVAEARNTGLKSVDTDTRYVAFLDSDDIWHEDHLLEGISALENGFDFYFCDNSRDDHHASYFQGCRVLGEYIKDHKESDGLVSLTRDELSSSILREFSSQVSTVIYRRAIAPDLLFDTAFRKAGEDILFLMQLASRAGRACCLPKIMVRCGKGINMYFGHLNWDSPEHLIQVITRMKAHTAIKERVPLSLENGQWNDRYIRALRRDIAFLSLRQFIKSRTWPNEIRTLSRDSSFFRWFPASIFQAGVSKALGTYRAA